MKNEKNRYASDAQLILAKLYHGASIIGLTLIAAAFTLYAAGVLSSNVTVAEVTSYWHLDAAAYAEQTGTPVGWGFLKELFRGDCLTFGSLLFMAMAVILSLAIMVAVFMRKRKPEFAVMALLHIVILLVAAAGVVSGG